MDTEEGSKELQQLVQSMKKANKRHHKKSQELQKNNLMLVQEIKESKGNVMVYTHEFLVIYENLRIFCCS